MVTTENLPKSLSQSGIYKTLTE